MVTPTDKDAEIAGAARVTQIIVFALAVGVCGFGLAALLLRDPQQVAEATDFLTVFMAGFAALAVVARLTVPQIVVRSNRRAIAAGAFPLRTQPAASVPQTDSGKLAAVYQATSIIGNALLEGAAFGNLFAFWNGGSWYSLAIAAVMVIGILVSFPTTAGVQSWVDRQLKLMEEERCLSALRND
jgi:hypothetical protein